MTSRMRTDARRLGLRYQGENGRLKFEKNSPTHKLWWGVCSGTKPRGGDVAKPFEELISIIDEYGPQVWTSSNHELFEPGVHKEYPIALQWPEDRAKIISIFRQMYNQRDPFQPAVERPTTISLVSKKKEASETTSNPPNHLLKSRSDKLVVEEKAWRSGPARSKPEVGATCEIEDLFLTDLWVTTPNGRYSARLKLGTHQTILSLFAAIEDAFFAENGSVDTRAVLGGLQEIIVQFTKLGPNLRAPQPLSKSDSDQKLRILRFNIYQGYERYREDEDGEVIIGRTTAIFDLNKDGKD